MRGYRGLILTGLFAAQGLFLWMYLSTHLVEEMAVAGLLQGAKDADAFSLAHRYAAEWRHGLVGRWSFYVPGFFAVTIATWFWSIGHSLRRSFTFLPLVTSLGLGGSLLFAPQGARLVLLDMNRELGIHATGPVGTPTVSGILLACYSVLAWTAFVVACHQALRRRSLWPLLVPAALDLILYVIRPFTADDLLATWLERASAGDPLACACLAAVPGSAGVLAVAELRYERRARCRGTGQDGYPDGSAEPKVAQSGRHA